MQIVLVCEMFYIGRGGGERISDRKWRGFSSGGYEEEREREREREK